MLNAPPSSIKQSRASKPNNAEQDVDHPQQRVLTSDERQNAENEKRCTEERSNHDQYLPRRRIHVMGQSPRFAIHLTIGIAIIPITTTARHATKRTVESPLPSPPALLMARMVPAAIATIGVMRRRWRGP